MAISVKHGVNTLNVDTLSGRSVQEILDEVGPVLNIPIGSQARVNGQPAEMSASVSDGSSVEFVKVAGEKGMFSPSACVAA